MKTGFDDLDNIVKLKSPQLILCVSSDYIIGDFLLNIVNNISIIQKESSLYIDNNLIRDCSENIKKERKIIFENKKYEMEILPMLIEVSDYSYDEGCHIDVFNEKELELYTDKLPNDSPILFLSKYFKGEIKLNNIRWSDIECGRITLNENKSFRDVPEIMEQMKGKNIK